MRDGIYVAVDFESSTQHGTWMAYCIMVCNYPQGDVLHVFTDQCCRNWNIDFDNATRSFWCNNSYQYRILVESASPVDEAEKRLCESVDFLKSKYPDFVLLCDNPSFDVAMMTDILRRHDRPPITERLTGYRQTVDTWSYKLAIKTLFPSYEAQGRLRAVARIADSTVKHLPVYDTARIMTSFFESLDFAKGWRSHF